MARTAQAAAAERLAGISPSGRVVGPREGASGTTWYGYQPVGLEPDVELDAPGVWPRIAASMLRGDAKLAGLSRMTHNALLSAQRSIKPGPSGSAAAERNADYARRMLGLDGAACMMREGGGLEGQLRKILSFVDTGYSVAEPLSWIDPRDGTVWLDRLADLDTSTVWEWHRDPRTGGLSHIVQQVSGGGIEGGSGRFDVDARKLLVFTLGQTGDNYRGSGGLLRPCRFWWRLKTHILDQLAIGAERWATPGMKIKTARDAGLDNGVEPYQPDEIDEMIANAEAGCKAYASCEGSTLRATDIVDMEPFAEGAYDSSHLLAVVNQANQEMATAYLAHFIELGLGDVGSRATGQVHWNSWRQSMTNLDEYETSVLMGPSRPGGGLVAKYLELNYYAPGTRVPPEDMPIMTSTGLDVDGFADALGTVAGLVGAGVLTADDAIEDRARRLIGVAPGARRADRTATAAAPVSQGGRPSDGPAEEV